MERPVKLRRLDHSAVFDPSPPADLAEYQHSHDLRTWDPFEDGLDFSSNHQWDNYFLPLENNIPNGDAGPAFHKRTHQTAFFDEDDHFNEQLPLWVAQQYPEFLPRIPSPRIGPIEDDENPFACEDGTYLHPALQHKREPIQANEEVVVNAFIKAHFRLPPSAKKKELSKLPLKDFHPQKQSVLRLFASKNPFEVVPNLPPHFGDVAKFNFVDRELFKFYTTAVCEGRTVVRNDNLYLKEVAPIAERAPCVKHAILALSASYVLDYRRNEILEMRANFHHMKAVMLLSEELKNKENYTPGKEAALISTLILLSHIELIHWEIDRSKEQFPKWHLATRLATRILDSSDPAYTYASPENVQFARARPQLANRVCLDSVLSPCVYPLDPSTSKCQYPWLLRGTESEQRKINGFTGLSSLLMHYFAKITHLSARRYKYPSSDVIPTVGYAIEKVLHNFWQWSELNKTGYKSAQDMLDSCVLELDEAGKVTTKEKVTDLVGESYVAAAQIYLQCRLFRRRRTSPIVQNLLRKLLRTVELQPTSGKLFTAQTPLFSVVIGGIVAYKPEDRKVIRDWFDPICVGSRGNVPPAWRAMQFIWEWLDECEDDSEEEVDDELDEDGDYNMQARDARDNSDAWWEILVGELSARYGRVNLA